jgi:DNA-binding response OmpR family regulator
MDASLGTDSPLKLVSPGRFTRVSVQTRAGEIEARLSEEGSWELLVRREQDAAWKLACTGDLDCGALTTQPATSPAEETVRLGPLKIEPAARRASYEEIELSLAKKEFALLLALAARPDRVVSKKELLESVWGCSNTYRTRTVDTHASRLRCKLRKAGAPAMIVNSWGFGYRLWERTDLSTFPSLTAVGEIGLS